MKLVLTMKISQGNALEVYKSIWPKMSIAANELKIANSGASMYQKVSSDYENFSNKPLRDYIH